jgi:hypothetical protein
LLIFRSHITFECKSLIKRFFFDGSKIIPFSLAKYIQFIFTKTSQNTSVNPFRVWLNKVSSLQWHGRSRRRENPSVERPHARPWAIK